MDANGAAELAIANRGEDEKNGNSETCECGAVLEVDIGGCWPAIFQQTGTADRYCEDECEVPYFCIERKNPGST